MLQRVPLPDCGATVACQGCKEPMAYEDISLVVALNRVALRFCCLKCLAMWIPTVEHRACAVCRGDGADVRIRRRAAYYRTHGLDGVEDVEFCEAARGSRDAVDDPSTVPA